MSDKKISADLLRGHTDTIILKLLMEGDKYGYELAKQVTVKSGGEYELKEATLYASLRRLEREKAISSYWGDKSQGGRRKYYHINTKGVEQFHINKQNWEYAKHILDELI